MEKKWFLILTFLTVISLLISGCSKSEDGATGLVVGDEIIEKTGEIGIDGEETAADEEAVTEENIAEEEEEEEEEEVTAETDSEETEEETEETDAEEEMTEPERTVAEYSVEIDENFALEELTIKVGDSVTWINKRSGTAVDKAMILGVRNCFDVRSKIFNPGESFTWTFTEAETCMIVDGVWTTMLPMKIIIEESDDSE